MEKLSSWKDRNTLVEKQDIDRMRKGTHKVRPKEKCSLRVTG